MQITLNIDTSDDKALALLNYIKTLEFVSFTDDGILTDKQKKAIDTGIDAVNKGNIQNHSEVMQETKERYPNLFQ